MSLDTLLSSCAVRVSSGPRKGYGTGFFVAPGLIVTCAHVIGDPFRPEFEVVWNGKTIRATLLQHLASGSDDRASPNGPDLALASVELDQHPCVLLLPDIGVGDNLYTFGYTDQYPDGDSASLIFEGFSSNRETLKLKQGQVRPGLSGAPLLNLRTGCVCGMVRTSRDRGSDLGGRAISTQTILLHFKQLKALQSTFHSRDRLWVAKLNAEQQRLLLGVPHLRQVPLCSASDLDGPGVATSVTFEGRSVTLRVRLPESPDEGSGGFVEGGSCGELAWLTKLIQSEETVRIVLPKHDTLTSYLMKAIRAFSNGSTDRPAMTLVLGHPTIDPNKWPKAGVYGVDDHHTHPKLIAGVGYETPEALFMWLLVLALRRNRMMQLAQHLRRSPRELNSQLGILKQKHWPSLHGVGPGIPRGIRTETTFPPVVIPALGSEVIRAILASQVETTVDLVVAARMALEKEDYGSLSVILSKLRKTAGSKPRLIRSEIRLLQAILDLAHNRVSAVEEAIARLQKDDLPVPLLFGLALLLLSVGDVMQAHLTIASVSVRAEEEPGLRVIQRLISLWAKTLGAGAAGSSREKVRSEFLDICSECFEQGGVSGAISLLLVHLALRLGTLKVADKLLNFSRKEYEHTAEFLHLAASVDLQRAVVYRQNNPDRDLPSSEKLAVQGCVQTLQMCISTASRKGLARPLLSLYTNLGLALHLEASFSTGETRSRLFEGSAQALQEAALHTKGEIELEARAANAWLLAGFPVKSAQLFGNLTIRELPPDLQSNAATALMMSGQPIEALKILEDLLKQKLVGWQMLANLAIVLFVTGQPSWAVSALEVARPGSGEGRWRVDYLLSKCFLKLGDPRRAEFRVRLALEQRSFDPQLYREHLYSFELGTVKDFRSLLAQLQRLFEVKKANTSILVELEQQVGHALHVYQESLQRHGGKTAQPGGLITHAFGEALARSDSLSAKLRALEEAVSSRQRWSADALIERVQEIAFNQFETAYTIMASPKASLTLQRPDSGIELKKAVSSAGRVLDGCSVPVVLRSESIGALSGLIRAGSHTDNVGHILTMAARVIENTFSEPIRCYLYVDRVEHRGFQRRTVHRVFNEMHGRAILADEVGLGKTIEAGLIFTEYRIRQMVKRCLILVPTVDLKEQWLNEFTSKFRLSKGTGDNSIAIQGNRGWRGWDQHAVCIATYQSAVNNASSLRTIAWDMLIADEAHHLRNRGSASFKLIARLTVRYLLLLSATPLQKGIEDIYSLASLVRPSLFGPLKRFRAEYGPSPNGKPRNLAKLNALLNQIMVRNTIVGVAGEIPTSRREFRNPSVRLSTPEMNFYNEVIAFVLAEAKRTLSLPISYYLLAREASSSPSTAMRTLFRAAAKDSCDWVTRAGLNFEALAGSIKTRSKVEELNKIIEAVNPRKVLIFVEFRTTAVELGKLLTADVIHGGLQPSERMRNLEVFRNDPQKRALIVTPAQGEGLNLEFCSVVVNYDLPWNPMRIEQRIGRVQRIGQEERVVTIYSLASMDTIEEEIRDGLVRKVKIFENVIGHIGLSFETDKRADGLESRICRIIRNAKDEPSLRKDLALFFGSETRPLIVDKSPPSPVASAPIGILVSVEDESPK
jgi:superfamily II DNA or RNA helicase